ncbi:MAG: alpha/beta fold hydrolase [Xanthomonadales bacterium]|nr:alpha/beta fold hydrolase [Xanthomonadales bacterium]
MTEIPKPDFSPHPLVRNAHIQSILASSALRKSSLLSRASGMVAASEELILHAGVEEGEEIRLQGFLSRPAQRAGRPGPLADHLVVMLHGWEGSANSNYMLDAGDLLWRQGYTVCRLNFRDHGDTHHLNPGIFHSCRLDEVVRAIGSLVDQVKPRHLFLAGFSLGGNFSLRVALRAPAAGLNIRHLVAVSPVISPHNGLRAIETAPWFYSYYFMRKWRRSLRRKAELFPQHQRVSSMLKADMRELTALLVENYTEFPDLDAYLDGYSVAGSRLQDLQVPATIITARDDPVIPLEDFHRLMLPASTRTVLTHHGGHCGFIESLDFGSWIPGFIADTLARHADAEPLAGDPAIVN